ncbi:serine hydrolase [Microbacterium jejuense]|uniref:Serine hydrolase n=1 Tax=Microbacterium jejuense TaxID=1263637 RepID=A0ABS7HNQ9_9MICO|nr:serine hydrolase [Microbacterium jejuense]
MIPSAPRLSGANRIMTSVAASQHAFPSGAATVLVASGYAPADGVIAAGLAFHLQAPLLYVDPAAAPAAVQAEIARLDPGRVIVIGGPSGVSDGVIGVLRTIVPDVQRFAGVNRYDSSRQALVGLATRIETVYLANGTAFVDSALASAAATTIDRATLLVDGIQPNADVATIDALRRVGASELVIVGGFSTIGQGYEQSLRAAGFTVSRRVASDPYAETVLMAVDQPQSPQRAIIVNPQTTPDLAVASALAAASGQPLFYAVEPCTPDTVAAHIAAARISVTAVGGPEWLGQAVLENRSCSSEKSLRESQLNQAIRDTAARYPGSFTVSVHQLDGLGVTTDVGGGLQREPASMMKIFAAWAALSRIERGTARFDTVLASGIDVGTCMYVMIHASDNYCHADIVHWIGIPQINAMIRGAGFTNTYYGSVPTGTSVLYAGNRTTTNDLVGMVERLEEGTILSRPFADHLLSLMQGQIWRARIASGIPPGVWQASKPGSLWVASGLLQGDTAEVRGPRSSYVLSVIGDDAPSQEAFRAISRTVYEYFNGSFGQAASYPAEQMVTVRATALRTSPGGPMTLVVPAGAAIQVVDANRVWYKVYYGQRELWTIFTDLRNR